MLRTILLAAAAASLAAAAVTHESAGRHGLIKRQVPADPTGVQEIVSPQGAKLTYKQPGKQGICETAEGVDDYAGYISLNERYNLFYWYFEARENPTEKPVSAKLLLFSFRGLFSDMKWAAYPVIIRPEILAGNFFD